MIRTELKDVLREKGIREDMYSLNGGLPNEAYCVNFNNEKWEVYYSEHGEKSNLTFFDTEEKACSYLLSLLEPGSN